VPGSAISSGPTRRWRLRASVNAGAALCSQPPGATISAIGREIGITRQGATKVVTHLVERGYVLVADSGSSGREKSVTLTALAATASMPSGPPPRASRPNCGTISDLRGHRPDNA
jgi:hypothetical protein